MEKAICQIEWVDERGNATPDKNESVGVATISFFRKDGSLQQEAHFPICSHHLYRMPSGPSYYPTGEVFSRWKFSPWETKQEKEIK